MRPNFKQFGTLVFLILLMFIVVYPIGMLIYGSFKTGHPLLPGDFSLINYQQAFMLPWLRQVMVNTLTVALVAVLLACFWGVTLGWIVGRTNTPFRGVMNILVLSSFFVPSIVDALAWRALLNPIGPIGKLLNLLGIQVELSSPFTIAFVMSISLTSYVFLFVSGAFASMDPSLEEASRMTGSSAFQTFHRITIPLVAPGILSGALLAFTMSVEAFSTPVILGLPGGFYTLSTKIYDLIRLPPVEYGVATVLGLMTTALTVVGMYFYRFFTKRKAFITITGKGYRPNIVDLGQGKYATFAFCLAFISFGTILPIGTIVINCFTPVEWDLSRFPTLQPLVALFQRSQFWLAATNTAIISLVTPTLIVILGIALSWLISRVKATGSGLLDYVVLLPLSIPPIVMGLGAFWAWIIFPIRIYGTLLVIILALLSRYLVYGVRSISSALVQIHPELEECSRTCGSDWVGTIRNITVPLLKHGILAGWLMVFVFVFRELSILVLLYTANTVTLSVLFLELTSEAGTNVAYAVGFVMVVTLLSIVILSRKVLRIDLQRA